MGRSQICPLALAPSSSTSMPASGLALF
jgi:hypothetical protein